MLDKLALVFVVEQVQSNAVDIVLNSQSFEIRQHELVHVDHHHNTHRRYRRRIRIVPFLDRTVFMHN
jgi:hypothetical protein